MRSLILNNYGIISEFNPFHKGHQYLTQQCRKQGATHITAIMSGNYVQRGDVAILPKNIRTKMALECGVDLVLELPTPYAVSNAQNFARGGVQIAYLSGCIDYLAFGSECGDIKKLKSVSELSTSETFKEYFKAEISKGISYPNALSNTALALGDDTFQKIIASPNNVLGIEYIKALNEIMKNNPDCKIEPSTITRQGDSHNSKFISSQFASASNIRKLIQQNNNCMEFLPDKSYDTLQEAIVNNDIALLTNNQRGVLTMLRNFSVEYFRNIADISEGLEYKLYNAVQNASTIDEVIEMTKSKRYTHARIRRLILSSFLGIKKEFTTKSPGYIRILGFNKKGTEILTKMKKTAKVPIITKISNLPNQLSEFDREMINFEIKSSDIYYTFTNAVKPCGMEYKNGIVVIK